MTARATRPKKPLAAKTLRTVGQPQSERGFVTDLPSMEEPTLQEMLRDPIIQRLMSSDGITRSQLMILVAAARNRMRGENLAPPAKRPGQSSASRDAT